MMKAVCVAVVGLMIVAGARADEPAAPSLNAQGANPQSQAPPPAGQSPFSQDSWVLVSYGGGSISGLDANVYNYRLGFGYYFLDRLSFNLEGVALFIDEDEASGRDAVGGGADALFRYHFYESGPWSLYADAGAGLYDATHRFPVGGTDYNFTPQAGLGLTYQLSNSVLLMGGARWYHSSNAGLSGTNHNPGYDSAFFYAGVMVPF